MRCQQIVNRLLDFSRQSLGEKKLLDINEILRRCVELCAIRPFSTISRSNRNWNPELPQIIGDPGQVANKSSPICSLNAADAISGSGMITLISRPTWNGNGVVLQFCDTAAASPRRSGTRSSTPFSPPRRRARAPGWACPSSTGSSSATAAPSGPNAAGRGHHLHRHPAPGIAGIGTQHGII